MNSIVIIYLIYLPVPYMLSISFYFWFLLRRNRHLNDKTEMTGIKIE